MGAVPLPAIYDPMAKAKRRTVHKIFAASTQVADVYLSCSWRKDQANAHAKSIVRHLDECLVRCVGDVNLGGDQDPRRLRRIINECSGFIVLLPYRPELAWKTSEYIWEELTIAAESAVPILVLYERNLPLATELVRNEVRLAIENQNRLPAVSIAEENFFGTRPFDASGPEEGSAGGIERFVEVVTKNAATHPQPFAFFSTRLKSDFGQARSAVSAAVEETLGMPCLWADSPEYSTPIENIHDRAKRLIQESQFVVADLTFGPESPEYDSPSRAHEIGMAQAFEKEILATAQAPRREPYFSASNLQLQFWKDESDLYRRVVEWTQIRERQWRYGRRNYSREVAQELPERPSQFRSKAFTFDRKRRYIAPNVFPLSMLERTIVALAFGAIAAMCSSLAHMLLKFDDFYDLGAVIAGAFAIVFASDLSHWIRQSLGQYYPLRWLIPALGIALIVLWALVYWSQDRTSAPQEKAHVMLTVAHLA